MGNLCFPGYDNDDSSAEHDKLLLRSREAPKKPLEDLNEGYREVEQRLDKEIDDMDKKVGETTEKLTKLRERMRVLLKDRDPEAVEPEESIRLQGLMDEENELIISLSSFSSNLVTLKKQRYEMERQYTEAMAFPPPENKEKGALDIIRLANEIAPQRNEFRKQFTKVLSLSHQQRADEAEEEKEDLLEGVAASEQLVGANRFTPDQLDRLKKLRALPPAPTKIPLPPPPVLKHTIETLSKSPSSVNNKPERVAIIPQVM